MSDSLRPHESQHARPPCPSPAPGVCPNSCPLSQWCHLTISSSVVPFCSCPQSFPTSGSFQMSQLFVSGGQNIGVSASTLYHIKFYYNHKSDNLAHWDVCGAEHILWHVRLHALPRSLSGKESICQCWRCRRLGFSPWIGKISWRSKWQPTPVFLPGKSHGQRNLVGYSPWSHKELDITERMSTHTQAYIVLFSYISCFAHMLHILHIAASFILIFLFSHNVSLSEHLACFQFLLLHVEFEYIYLLLH